MAAIFFTATPNNNTIYKSGFSVTNSVSMPFLQNFIGGLGGTNVENGLLIVTEITMQHRDTIQYFLTFDDFISYYYFGKGLGSLTISGLAFSDRLGAMNGLYNLTNQLASIRGTQQNISFGNVVLIGVMNSFTLRASADLASLHAIDFNVQMDIIDSSLPPAVFTPSC